MLLARLDLLARLAQRDRKDLLVCKGRRVTLAPPARLELPVQLVRLGPSALPEQWAHKGLQAQQGQSVPKDLPVRSGQSDLRVCRGRWETLELAARLGRQVQRVLPDPLA